ncbi:anthranilate phosphoribosyltransferase TrpD [Lactarius vividus]|nr:anthranilate phosphoribosyltransferase TrpD [Lactarius vividus]
MSQSDLNPASFKLILSKLIKSPQDFTDADIQLAINHVVTPGAALPEQVGAFLTGLTIARVELRKDLLLAAASFVYSRSIPAIVNDADKHFIVDIVGTGGDGHNTFNVSTTAAMIAAGAGARVIKHGSGASTSSSGSADLLHALGCVFTPPRGGKPSPVPDIPLVFLLAPHYHPALAALAPARRALPFRTLFNALGPLLNPARPRGMLVGVAEPAAPSIPTTDFGLPIHPLTDVRGASPAENAATLRALLTSSDDIPERLTPILDFVLLNAAALLVVAGRADNFVDGVALAKEAVTSGKAWRALELFREYSLKDAAEAVVGG